MVGPRKTLRYCTTSSGDTKNRRKEEKARGTEYGTTRKGKKITTYHTVVLLLPCEGVPYGYRQTSTINRYIVRTVRACTVHPSPEASRPTRSSALSYSTVSSGKYLSHIRYHTLHTGTLIRTKWFTSHPFRRCCLLLRSASGSEAAVLRHSSVHSLSSSLTFHPFTLSSFLSFFPFILPSSHDILFYSL